MKSLNIVLQELFKNGYLLHQLSLHGLKKKYASSFLGSVWLILNPSIQIFIYWLVFGLGIRGGGSVDGIPFFIWMLTGIIPWLYITQSITQSSNSIYSSLSTVTKMNFPLSVIPVSSVLSQLYIQLFMLMILLGIVFYSQGFSIYNFMIIYYLFTVTIFLNAIGFIFSTLTCLSRDFHLALQSGIRMLFYLTPILWVPGDNVPKLFIYIIKLNPFYYIIEGFRESLLFHHTSIFFSGHTFYFWGITGLLLVYGSYLHVKFRKQFVDYL